MAKKHVGKKAATTKKKKGNMKKLLSAPQAIAMKAKPAKENPFETIWNRRKFDIVGKKRKGEERLIGSARSKGIEQRKKTLLKEYKQSGKSSAFLDKRIGERDDALGEFDKSILRFQREQQLKWKKKSKYNLSDGEEDDFEIPGGGSLSKLDDFDDEMLQDDIVDATENLHSIGGLVPLLGYLKNSYSGIRAKAADVVTTVVQNNPKSQQLVMEANGLEPLLTNFISDPDITVRTKALGAISSLVRHNKPGVAAFRLANGYAALKDALGSDNVRFQRKALNLIQYLLQENGADCHIVTELGFPRIMMHLASSDDADVREGALRSLLELTRGGTPETSSVTEEEEKLKQVLQSRIDEISSMAPEDLGAAKEERQLVDSLWQACYNEPSSLREKGLLVLAGEDEPPPDVASKILEPPLRAFAANRAPSTNAGSEKKESPLLLGFGAPPAGNSQVQNDQNAGGS